MLRKYITVINVLYYIMYYYLNCKEVHVISYPRLENNKLYCSHDKNAKEQIVSTFLMLLLDLAYIAIVHVSTVDSA